VAVILFSIAGLKLIGALVAVGGVATLGHALGR
jgi:hypothetical protein